MEATVIVLVALAVVLLFCIWREIYRLRTGENGVLWSLLGEREDEKERGRFL